MKLHNVILGAVMTLAGTGFAQTTEVSPHVFRVESGVDFELNHNGFSGFLFNWTDSSGNVVNEEDPTLILTAGEVYTFRRLTGSHPFVITDSTLPVTGTDGFYERDTFDGALIDASTLNPIADFTADPGPTADMIEWSLVSEDIGEYYYTCRVEFHVGMTGRVQVVAGAPAADERDVQIRSVDFDNEIVELYNYGQIDQDLTGWRTCTHDFDQVRRYSASNGLDGVMIESGTSVYIHYNNDAPADPDHLNISTIGGGFSLPLDQDAYGMQLFFPDENGSVSFGNSNLIADHVQWNIDGQGVGNAEFRTNQAVSVGLWTAIGDFVATESDSESFTLTDAGDGRLHGPASYIVSAPCAADLNGDGFTDFVDISFFINELFDFNGDTVFDFADISSFVAAFTAGCQ